jgi:hypothetical protein
MMGYAASVENLILVYITGYIFFNWKIMFRLSTHVTYMAYCAVSSVILILLLAMVNYNVGLGQRQKMMAVPAILLIYGSIYMYKRYLRSQTAPSAATDVGEMPQMTAAQA